MGFIQRFLAGWRQPPPDEPEEIGGEIIHTLFGDRVEEEASLLRWVEEHGTCPDCEGKFLCEPQIGFYQNVLCQDCHSEFTLGPTFVQRVGERGAGRVFLYKTYLPPTG